MLHYPMDEYDLTLKINSLLVSYNADDLADKPEQYLAAAGLVRLLGAERPPSQCLTHLSLQIPTLNRRFFRHVRSSPTSATAGG
jgi:hypothetical protein